jgi:adenine specific DNA methylase Mod
MIQDIVKDNEQVTPVSREMEGLREYFPQCFNKEGEFDIDKFREAIEPQVDVTREGRSYDFLGKSYARMLSSLDTTTVIRPDTEHNAKPENHDSENIYISGDNLDALHHLVKSYAGQVKCIYIDPPYNTGTDGFVYNDKFKFTAEELEKKLSISPDEAEKIIAMTSGHRASHAAWLTFMMPRLQLARDLLSKDGVIFISIDDNEQAYLKQLCDFIFGEDNFVAQFIWISKTGGGSDNNAVVADHEYVLCYARNNIKGNAISKLLIDSEALNLKDEYGPYRLGRELNKWGSNSRREDRPTMFFPIPGPNGEDVYPIRNDNTEGCWRWGKAAMLNAVNNHNVEYSKRENGTYIVYEKIRTTDPRTKPYRTFLKNCGTTAEGTKQIKALFGSNVFDYPKPVELVQNLLEMGTEDGDLIVDFFGGSSTTAQAIMELNQKEDAMRKYILIQIPESPKDKSEAQKAGYRTIDEIGMERIKRAAKKIREENPLFAGDLGFKHYTLEEVPQDTLDKLETFDPNVILSTDDVLTMFGRDTVLQTWLVNDGYGLGAKTEDIVLDTYHATLCGNHLYLTDADFTEDAMTALVDRYQSDPSFNPDCIVLFGYSFGHNAKDMLEKNKPTINLVKDKNIIIDVRY